jgi:hypothetical protein
MGVVWAARNEAISRDVAIKVMLPRIAEDPVALQRFFNEAKICGSIRHPGIVDVLDLGRAADGSPFLVMELLEGESLDDRLNRVKRMPPSVILPIARDVARTIAMAHKRGIIHRDIKPANIFLHRASTGEEIVKVLDFGISKVLAPEFETKTTHTGAVVLGLDDKIYVDEEGSATGPGGGGSGGGAGGAGGAGVGGAGGAGGGVACPVVPAVGAPGQSLWVTTSTSSQPASMGGVAVDGCGDIWVTAKFTKDIKLGDCPLRLSDAGGAVFWAKLDGATGTCKASGVIGGANNVDFAEPRSIAVDAAGNAVIAGHYKGFLNLVDAPGYSKNDSYDPFVIKLDPDGGVAWLKANWGSDLDDGANAVAVDPSDGSVVVAGLLRGSMLIDTVPETTLASNVDSSDILLAKIDKDGYSQWAHRFGSSQADAASGVAVRTPSGAIGLTGIFAGTVDFLQKSLTTTGTPDAFAAAFDSIGTVCSYVFTPLANPSSSGVSVAWTGSVGQLAVVGELNGIGSFSGTTLNTKSGDTDSFLALLDSTAGGADSATRIGQPAAAPMAVSPDRIKAVAAVPGSKHVLIAGSFRDSVLVGDKTATSAGGDDILVARLDETLKAAWVRSIGTMNDQEASAAAVDPDTGAPVIGGRFSGMVDFGTGSSMATITPQIFVLKLAP